MLAYELSMLAGDCVQLHTPGTYASSTPDSVFVLSRDSGRPSSTSSPTDNSRCDAPAALPVTTTRSSTPTVRDMSGATSRDVAFGRGVRTTWSPLTLTTARFVSRSRSESTFPTGVALAATQTMWSSGSSSALYDRRSFACAVTRSSASRNASSVEWNVTGRSSGGGHRTDPWVVSSWRPTHARDCAGAKRAKLSTRTTLQDP